MADSRNPTSVSDLADCEYVLLTTYTDDGTAKPTPVWAAQDDDALVLTTAASAWKVRRARSRPFVTVSACDARGNPRGGPVDAVAVIVDGVHHRRVLAALRHKYGWKLATIEAFAKLRRRPVEQVGLVLRDV